AAEDVVDDVFAAAGEEPVAVEILLEADLRARRLDDTLLDARASGTRRGRQRPGRRRIVRRHAQLARHQVDDGAGNVLAVGVRALGGEGLRLRALYRVQRAQGDQRERGAG